MRSLNFSLTIIFLCLLLASCTKTENNLDKKVRFAINTADGSRGLQSFELPDSDNLSAIPQDPRNPLTVAKVQLGQQLFHESGFATAGSFPELKQTYSCASCHHAGGGFQANMPQGIGEGGLGFGNDGDGRRADVTVVESMIDVQPLRTPSVLNSAYQTNMLWNGQFGATGTNTGTEDLWPENTPIAVNKLGFEGVEIQAIAGLEVHRHEFSSASVIEMGYKEMFDKAFGNVPESERYSDVQAGLAIAAYERTVLANQSPFQLWLKGNDMAMTVPQKEGAILFFDKGQCINCHNGPGLAKMEFHAIGMNDFSSSDVLNFNPQDPAFLGRASFTKDDADNYKFKVPQLYNLKDSPFFGHGASFRNVKDIITYKNGAQAENQQVPAERLSPYFTPLDLEPTEIELISLFVEEALYDPNLERYAPTSIQSGMCFPNNDWMSRDDLGCN